jgi:hypothetical protein
MQKHVWMSVLMAVVMAACSSGGEVTGKDSDALSDLTLVQTTPTDSQAGMERSAGITAEFNTALDVDSIDSTSAWISGPEGNAIAATVGVEGSGLRLQPNVPLPGGTTYTVTLGTGISDTWGRRLGAAQTLRFTTKPQAWQTELTEVSRFDDFESWLWPDMAADDQGNVLVAWVQSGLVSQVALARLDAATGAWSETATFPIASGLTGWPRAFAGADGEAHVIWSEYGTPDTEVYMATYGAGRWSTPSRIQVMPAGTLVVTPLLEPNGNITLAGTTHEQLLVVRYDAAQDVWSGPHSIVLPDEHSAAARDIRLVADDAGNVLLAWTEREDSGNRPIYAARFDSGTGQWAATQKVSTDTSGGLFPQTPSIALGVDAKGVATMAWAQPDDADEYHAMASRLDPVTNRWTTPAQVAQGAKVNVAVDRAGYATLTWHSDGWLLSSRLAPAGTAWSPPVRIGEQEILSGWIETTPLVVDIAGNVTAVYSHAGSEPQITASRFSVDTGQWSAPQGIDTERIETLTLAWGSPAVAVDGSGTVTSTWLAVREGGGAALASNRLR